MDNQVCVVIPVYKALNRLSRNEQLSWQQCLRILRSRTIYLACPPTLITEDYIAAAAKQGVVCKATLFAPKYFSSIDGYNRLMLSRQFYSRFAQYDYLLLYQLDAFIFRDELTQWCNMGYSYVGAPWFDKYVSLDDSANLWAVGNGGFALRRVADCLRVLNTVAVARSWAEVIQNHSPHHPPNLVRRAYLTARYLLCSNNTHWLGNDFYRYRKFHQEDYFWGVVCSEKFSWYKVPTPQKALAFAFESAPSRMYVFNHQQLPMGCHAWEKHEPEFWLPFINQAVTIEQ